MTQRRRSLNADTRRRVMASIKSHGTKPEIAVRQAAHAAGLRFRLQRRELPGCPDLVFPSRRLAVFVHGCFWHQHDDPACPIRKPAGGSNQSYWKPKLERNVARDAKRPAELQAIGWHILVIWECETLDPQKLAEKISDIMQYIPYK